jgi:hypothetical protein
MFWQLFPAHSHFYRQDILDIGITESMSISLGGVIHVAMSMLLIARRLSLKVSSSLSL